jgi:hypothetical protein
MYRPNRKILIPSFTVKWEIVRKLPGIPRELPRHVDRATYPEGMLGVLSKKHYADSPLLLSELDVWRLEIDIIKTLIKLFRLENHISEKRKKFSERKILNFFPFRKLREANI